MCRACKYCSESEGFASRTVAENIEQENARHTMILLFIFSGLVGLGYGAQMRLAKRERCEGVDADERVR